jgi:imidazolonepropionase-like amidohydrolase
LRKNKIIDVVKGYANAGATDRQIDLKAYTVMPGLMDCHVHFEEQTSPTLYSKK